MRENSYVIAYLHRTYFFLRLQLNMTEEKVKEFFNFLAKFVSKINHSEINYIYLIIFLIEDRNIRANLYNKHLIMKTKKIII